MHGDSLAGVHQLSVAEQHQLLRAELASIRASGFALPFLAPTDYAGLTFFFTGAIAVPPAPGRDAITYGVACGYHDVAERETRIVLQQEAALFARDFQSDGRDGPAVADRTVRGRPARLATYRPGTGAPAGRLALTWLETGGLAVTALAWGLTADRLLRFAGALCPLPETSTIGDDAPDAQDRAP